MQGIIPGGGIPWSPIPQENFSDFDVSGYTIYNIKMVLLDATNLLEPKNTRPTLIMRPRTFNAKVRVTVEYLFCPAHRASITKDYRNNTGMRNSALTKLVTSVGEFIWRRGQTHTYSLGAYRASDGTAYQLVCVLVEYLQAIR